METKSDKMRVEGSNIHALFGKKLGLTQIFDPKGERVPVTVLEVGPCIITQIKKMEEDGYNAIQLGYSDKPIRMVNRPLKGHLKRSNSSCGFYLLREVRVNNIEGLKEGDSINVDDVFQKGDRVLVRGNSKGRGFSGVVKRWGFKGGKKTHGSMFHRAPGSIGAAASPSRVLKGKKLPGRMGGKGVTIKGLRIIDVIKDQNLLFVKGSVPGSKNSFLSIELQG